MKAVRFAIAAALLLSLPALAAAGVHSIWSDSGMYISDNSGSTLYPVTEGGVVISWSESTGAVFANLHGRAVILGSPTPTFRDYDVELISGSASFPTEDVMFGQWNIRRNGALICGNCRGTLVGLDSGSSIQFFDSTNKFRFFASVGARKDY
ncbi:hypothetical protein D7Y13_17180 [Corallococcus praedator]|uniref:Uncharacterized protein n=1 Tax=Corallococcus praedator TaxID=2316724 RepID=A0ABX9QI05_9BACT|nr:MULTISPECIES: hypothetical protein [Corallococcus]RKH16739.1 hypothetical protein D7X74_14570 [Corallococcus sp. CA047B]RKH33440.1 hypothetical protein D7X75_12000 [Corallococcus sp. CA031C]RKI07783.1 hypothetical protein D7Y13_17180 [Corallococcus praedator]